MENFLFYNYLAGAEPEAGHSINNPLLNKSLQDIVANRSPVEFFNIILPNFITLALIIGVVVFLFIILIGAIQWISSCGDKNALEGAKSKITNAFIGIVILFAVFAVLKIIESFFGITILTLDIGSLVIR